MLSLVPFRPCFIVVNIRPCLLERRNGESGLAEEPARTRNKPNKAGGTTTEEGGGGIRSCGRCRCQEMRLVRGEACSASANLTACRGKPWEYQVQARLAQLHGPAHHVGRTPCEQPDVHMVEALRSTPRVTWWRTAEHMGEALRNTPTMPTRG